MASLIFQSIFQKSNYCGEEEKEEIKKKLFQKNYFLSKKLIIRQKHKWHFSQNTTYGEDFKPYCLSVCVCVCC